MTEEYDIFQAPIEEWLAARRNTRGPAEGEDGGFVIKDFMELNHYTVKHGDLVFVPVELAYDDDACCLVAQIWEPLLQSETRTFTGPNRDGTFHFAVENTRLAMDLRSNVIRRERRLSEAVPKKTEQLDAHIRVLDNEIIEIERDFADAHLSELIRALAEDVTDSHYYWTLEGNGYGVMFEMPVTFRINSEKAVHLLSYHLSVFSVNYMTARGITGRTYLEMLLENKKRDDLAHGRLAGGGSMTKERKHV